MIMELAVGVAVHGPPHRPSVSVVEKPRPTSLEPSHVEDFHVSVVHLGREEC